MIYVITCVYLSGVQKVIKACTSLNKAKRFCKTSFGIKAQDWIYNEKEKCYFYNSNSYQKRISDVLYDTINIFLIEIDDEE